MTCLTLTTLNKAAVVVFLRNYFPFMKIDNALQCFCLSTERI